MKEGDIVIVKEDGFGGLAEFKEKLAGKSLLVMEVAIDAKSGEEKVVAYPGEGDVAVILDGDDVEVIGDIESELAASAHRLCQDIRA